MRTRRSQLCTQYNYVVTRTTDSYAALAISHRRRVGDLLEKVSSAKLHAQYGKAREADGHYQEAAKAYETAREFDNAVR